MTAKFEIITGLTLPRNVVEDIQDMVIDTDVT